MEEGGGYGLLDNDAPPPNAYRIKREESTNKFPKEFPGALRGTMEEGEFVDYIAQVNEATHVSKKLFSLMVVPFILFPIAPVVGVTTEIFYLTTICGFIWFIVSAAIMFTVGYVISRRSKNAIIKTKNLIAQINQRLYPRGVRWDLVIDPSGAVKYIDIVQFDPSAAEGGSPYDSPTQMPYSNTSAPFKPIDTQFQSSSSSYDMQAYPPSTTAPLLHHPSAPPPSTTAPYQFTQINTSEDPSLNYSGGTPIFVYK